MTANQQQQPLDLETGDDMRRLSRRSILRRSVLGITGVGLVSLLAACGGDEEDSTGEARNTSWHVSVRSGYACGKGTHLDAHVLEVTSDGAVSVLETVVLERGSSNCSVGRRPRGLRPRVGPRVGGAQRTLGVFFAEQAELEAASVVAFDQIARELTLLGAPRALVQRARSAGADEVRHAVTTRELAERFGATVQTPRIAASAARTLFDFAYDNAVEGCVRETYGALVASVQARRAADPDVAKAMRTIAVEETVHAALSWDLATWAEAQLTSEQVATLRSAQRAAFTELRASVHDSYSAEIRHQAGLPDVAVATALLEGLEASLLEAPRAA